VEGTKEPTSTKTDVKRLSLAKRAVHERRVIIYRIEHGLDVYCVLSRRGTRAYVVIPKTYCACSDFFFNTYLTRRRRKCYHLEAIEEAVKRGKTNVVEISWEEFEKHVLPKIILGFLL